MKVSRTWVGMAAMAVLVSRICGPAASQAKARVKLNAALFNAVTDGTIAQVKALLQRGANPNATGEYNMTALNMAVGYRDVAMVVLLLDKGANIHSKGLGGPNDPFPLGVALRRGDLAMTKLLMSRGAKLSEIGDGLDTAASDGNDELIKFMLAKGANVDFRTHFSESTPLMAACAAGKLSTVRLLIEKGANVNAVNDLRQTALMAAVVKSDYDKKADTAAIVKLLLAKDAKVDATSSEGETALKLAETAGRAEVIKLLKAAGAK
jgi:ankyrin repeat protein